MMQVQELFAPPVIKESNYRNLKMPLIQEEYRSSINGTFGNHDNTYSDEDYYCQFNKAQSRQVEAADYRQQDRHYKFSIIVPYRENPYQNRQQQLDRFVPYMTDYLAQLGSNYDFQIIVVEQSQDGRKFNRGQLLNLGFHLACEQGCEYHIFHDVDLLPDDSLLGYYGLYPESPLHIAAVWEKYQYLDLYFGGVCSFTTQDFERLNGYPNNFWGWGGEDEELYHRIVAHKMTILEPLQGRFTELPHIHTKEFPELVNEERFELIEQRVEKGEGNGLSDLHFKQVDQSKKLNCCASKFFVIF